MHEINAELLRNSIKYASWWSSSSIDPISTFFISLTNHTSSVYLCTRAFNNRFWPRFNFALFTYKIDWNVFVITNLKTCCIRLFSPSFKSMFKWRGRKVIHYKEKNWWFFWSGMNIFAPHELPCWIISLACKISQMHEN